MHVQVLPFFRLDFFTISWRRRSSKHEIKSIKYEGTSLRTPTKRWWWSQPTSKRKNYNIFDSPHTHTHSSEFYFHSAGAWARSEKLRVCEKGKNEKGTTAAARNICLWTRLLLVYAFEPSTHIHAHLMPSWSEFPSRIYIICDVVRRLFTLEIVKNVLRRRWSEILSHMQDCERSLISPWEKRKKGAGNFFLTFLSVFPIPFSFFSGNIHALFSTTCVLNAEQ